MKSMLKFKTFCRSAYALLYVIALVFISISPKTIATHINGNGMADAHGNRFLLLLAPLLYTIVVELVIYATKRKRTKAGLKDVNFILASEYRWIGALIVIFVVFVIMMWIQIN
ncbi:DUF1648 domain-containing protein [Lactiplantibacillus pentosus]|jgi:hypothetical protein|nr:DUF1648 domain-containing protein [Lactiplantibacillus pentosus]